MNTRHGESGLTLLEVLVSLSLFALIGVAGFAIVESVLGVRDRTDGRLERLGDIQRAMHLMRLDFEQAGDGPLRFDGVEVFFRRHEAGSGEALDIAYRAESGALTRRVRLPLSPAADQRLLDGVASARWRFYRAGNGWLEEWPPPEVRPPPLPDAVEIVMEIGGGPSLPGGRLRRVVRMPRGAKR